jgi:hypothetical protein
MSMTFTIHRSPHLHQNTEAFNPFFRQEYRLFSSQNSPFPSLTTSTIDHMLSTLQYFQGPLQKKKLSAIALNPHKSVPDYK